MQSKSELILASRNAVTGDDIFTFKLKLWKLLNAELNTHRVFSRNSASSRAVPSKKFRARVLKDTFIPDHWPANQKGMQGGAVLAGWRQTLGRAIWKAALYPSLAAGWMLERIGFHKQIGNRLLEPWLSTEVLVTTTELDNFFALRDHWMAEPHFRDLAHQMHRQVYEAKKWMDALEARTPSHNFVPKLHVNHDGIGTVQVLEEGEWHLPFIDAVDINLAEMEAKAGNCVIDRVKRISAARCARVSYFLPETGERSDYKRDLELYDRLVVREPEYDRCGPVDPDPIHASPVEHQAKALHDSVWSGNFKGWMQHRKEIPGEAGTK